VSTKEKMETSIVETLDVESWCEYAVTLILLGLGLFSCWSTESSRSCRRWFCFWIVIVQWDRSSFKSPIK